MEATGITGGTGNLSIAWEWLAYGIYCVEVTDATGCMEVFCDSLGVTRTDVLLNAGFQLHPNPAIASVSLVLPDTWEVESIVLRDALGREVGALSSLGSTVQLDMMPYAPGTYYLEVRHKEGSAVERLMVRR